MLLVLPPLLVLPLLLVLLVSPELVVPLVPLVPLAPLDPAGIGVPSDPPHAITTKSAVANAIDVVVTNREVVRGEKAMLLIIPHVTSESNTVREAVISRH